MGNYTEEGYFLGKIPYGENGALVTFYTRSSGKIKFFCYNIQSKKTNVKCLYPLDRVELELTSNRRDSLPYIRTISIIETFGKNPTQTIGNLFLSELLTQLLNYSDESFYQYLRSELQQVRKGWYLNVCWKWIEIEGLMPDFRIKLNSKYWDMFTDSGVEIPSEHAIPSERKETLSSFVLDQKITTSTKELLESTLAYLRTHISTYKPPKSLEIITKVY